MLKGLLPPLLLAVAVFVAAEVSYRLYALGPAGLSPRTMNSMSTLLQSGLVRPASQHEVWFELPPNLDATFAGAPLRTNSAGLVDREYSTAKSPGTFRVAVLGSSWTMASGVAPEHAWHAVMEEHYATHYEQQSGTGQPRVEFINFALETYGLSEIAGTLRHKVMAYDPDLILVSITMTTNLFRPPADGELFTPPDVRKPFTESLLLSALAAQFNYPLYQTYRRPVIADERRGKERIAPARENFLRSMREMHGLAQSRGIPLIGIWLGPVAMEQSVRRWTKALNDEIGIRFYEGSTPLLDMEREITYGETRFRPEYRVSRFNNHPNAAGHRLIADKLLADLIADGHLPSY
ncbi:MAG: SGNH/GDSL hydrolase family protein [Gammaproteobacteria bacterium]|nr:SGNH/GDSL hydrolase family protein [Gammaproteobacteria bacterium]